MKNYLFIMQNDGHPWGGSEPLWSSAAEYLVRRGNRVRVSVKDWGRPVPQIEHLRSAGCQIFYRRPLSLLSRAIRRIIPLPPYPQSHVRTLGKGMDLVVVSQGSNTDGLEWLLAAKAAGYKYAAIAQSAVVYWWPPDEVAEMLADGYENASAAYFVSQANLELSRRQFGSALRNAKVVRNPFNVAYDANPPWPANSGDELRLAFVGRLDVISKGLDVPLQVLGLPHWRERKVRLSLFGNGPHERCLRGIAEQLKLNNVDFRGQSNDIEGIWAEHHALVLPSRFEGMPLVVVEAMLCGRPCIVTDVGGNRELVRDGINGFMAKAPTVELLDEAMNRAWESRTRLKEMGRIAAKDVRQFVSRDPGEDFARELAALAGDVDSNAARSDVTVIGAPIGVPTDIPTEIPNEVQ
jgi:glycosyltransferase involved in cell wall biosynthesis